MIKTDGKITVNSNQFEVLPLERFLPHKVRRKIYFIFKYATILSAIIYIGLILVGNLEIYLNTASGTLIILLAVTMILFSMESFFDSHYGGGESTLIASNIIYLSNGDITKSLLKSTFGKKLILRSEIPHEIFDDVLQKRSESEKTINLSEEEALKKIYTTEELVLAVYEADPILKRLFLAYGIDSQTLGDIASWVLVDMEKEHRRELWWWPEYLAKVPGIAKDWNFGRLFYLVKYGRDLAKEATSPNIDFDIKEFGNEVRQLESILSKGHQSNAILVGEPGAGVLDMILEFVRKLNRGKIHPALEHKRVFIMEWTNLIASNKDKNSLERSLISLLNEAINAGNIMLVIDDLPGFMLSAEVLGVNIQNILDPYLASELQIIATSDNTKFHKHIEKNSNLMMRFDRINIEETDQRKTIEILENTIRKIEKKTGLFFSYPAVKEIVAGSVQYFPGTVLPDGAINLLFEIVGSVHTKDGFVTRNEVLDFIEMKTKIPLGKMESTEKEKLLHLESILHERIVGQEEAISVLSNAMRRTRADIRNTKKPIGTFLFLGPTGVGKTETAKALSAVFFGDERFMMRLDMTEYQKEDSLPRLIGSFESGKPGVLSSMLRENPYGVLLLDEFEKAEKDVQNLFLQILDEGFFSDMDGKKVSLRNVIIIATSNAASEYIFKLIKEGRDLSGMQDDIVQNIVDGGVFKPELINRFDASVIFHPLDKSELFQIAGLMLKKLKKRLAEKGIDLELTDELAMAVATEGSNEIFGARPMNRFIQDRIEQYIAKKMISGEIKGGSSIRIDPKEI